MPSLRTYLVPSSSYMPSPSSYAQPHTIPGPSSYVQPQTILQLFPVCSRCHAHNSWFISTSYMMSTSILITFMFMVPGRLLRRDVPLVHRYPTVTSGDPTPSTRLPLDEGRKSQACTSLPSRTVFLPLSIELVHFDL